VALKLQVVDDATNVPLAQAAVRCSTPIVTLGPRLSAANTGAVQFDNAAGDSYICTGELFAYLPGYVVATVFPMSEPTVYIIRLKKNPACLEGTVYDSVTLIPLDASTVFCSTTDKSFTTSTRITGSMGKYYFEPVPAGDYRCFASRTKYYPNSNQGSVEPGKMGIIDVYLVPLPGGVIGHVWNQNGMTPVPGVTISCQSSDGQLPLTQTDATGFYSIQNVTAGPVSCSATLTDYTSGFKVDTVFRSQNTTIDFIIAELPGQLIVHVLEEGTNTKIPGASVECSSIQVPIISGLTDGNATVAFGTVAAGTFRCSAVATGYYANSVTGIIVIRNKLTETTILLKPLPGILIITTVDDSNDNLLPNASVVVNGVSNYGPQLTDITATTTFTVPAGTYSSTGSLFGYISGSKSGFVVTRGGTTRVQLRLIPLPGLLIVNVIGSDINGPLPGALVVLTGQTLTYSNSSLAPVPTASISYLVQPGIYRAVGSATGYTTDTKLTPQIGRNTTTTITLILDPVPNTIIVTVLDIANNQPITFSRVSLSGAAAVTSGVDGFAKAYFYNMAAGNYSAGATATGYSPNGTYVGMATRNQTLSVTIYLRQLPCTIQVNVISNNTGLPIPTAGVSLNFANTSTLTNAQGFTTYIFSYDFVSNPVASASKSGYRDGSTPFTCGRGVFVNVTVLLNEVLEITLAAIDALTSSKPYLQFAKIYFNDVLITRNDPQNPNLRLYAVDSLPVRGIVKGTAGGFNDKVSDPITFTLTNRAFNISLAPQEFTVFFIPAEVLSTGGMQRVFRDGTIHNNFDTTTNDTVAYYYKPNSITAGGSATQLSDPPTSQSFVGDTYILFTDPANFDNSGYAFAATFPSLLPSSQIPFTLSVKDLDTLKANAPGNVTSLDVFIPEFASQIERTIIFEIPMKLGAAYFNIRVTPMLPNYSVRSFASGDFCFARVTLKKAIKYTNYDKVLGNSQRAVFESFIAFGDEITKIEIGYPSESYNTTLSNWADVESSPFPNLRPFKPTETAPAELTKFLWPPAKLLNNLFTPLTTTKQQGRNPNALLYYLQDYVLIYTPRTKRSEEN